MHDIQIILMKYRNNQSWYMYDIDIINVQIILVPCRNNFKFIRMYNICMIIILIIPLSSSYSI